MSKKNQMITDNDHVFALFSLNQFFSLAALALASVAIVKVSGQTSPLLFLGCIKPMNGMNYQPQRVTAGFLNHQKYVSQSCLVFWMSRDDKPKATCGVTCFFNIWVPGMNRIPTSFLLGWIFCG